MIPIEPKRQPGSEEERCNEASVEHGQPSADGECACNPDDDIADPVDELATLHLLAEHAAG